jgi:hypothetical protein
LILAHAVRLDSPVITVFVRVELAERRRLDGGRRRLGGADDTERPLAVSTLAWGRR